MIINKRIDKLNSALENANAREALDLVIKNLVIKSFLHQASAPKIR